MSDKKILEIGTANASQIATAQMLFGRTFKEDASWITEGIKNGFYKADAVAIEKVDRYLVVYHVNDQKHLFINAIAQLTKDFSEFAALAEAMTEIAKKNLCKAIEGITVRPGVVERLKDFGFIPAGVVMTKVL